MAPASGVGPDHPMRKVTRQVAFERGWSADRARKVADLFDGMAAEWDEPRSGLVRTAPIRDASTRGGMMLAGRWLELGAGTGVATRILAPAVSEAGGSLIAADLALEMLRRSPARAAPLVQGDASSLPFADGVFDGVALINMLLFPDEVTRMVTAGPDGAGPDGAGPDGRRSDPVDQHLGRPHPDPPVAPGFPGRTTRPGSVERRLGPLRHRLLGRGHLRFGRRGLRVRWPPSTDSLVVGRGRQYSGGSPTPCEAVERPKGRQGGRRAAKVLAASLAHNRAGHDRRGGIFHGRGRRRWSGVPSQPL